MAEARAGKAANMAFYILESIVLAWVFALFSFFVIYRRIAGEVPLYAYLWNLIFIVAILLFERLENSFMLSKRFCITEQTKPYRVILAKALYLTHIISFKTALYLFYLVILLVSRAAFLRPEIISDYLRNYIHSIEYCVLLLIPFDKFVEQIAKDDRRTRRIHAKLVLPKKPQP